MKTLLIYLRSGETIRLRVRAALAPHLLMEMGESYTRGDKWFVVQSQQVPLVIVKNEDVLAVGIDEPVVEA